MTSEQMRRLHVHLCFIIMFLLAGSFFLVLNLWAGEKFPIAVKHIFTPVRPVEWLMIIIFWSVAVRRPEVWDNSVVGLALGEFKKLYARYR